MSFKLKHQLQVTLAIILLVTSVTAQQSLVYAQDKNELPASHALQDVDKDIDVPYYKGDKIYWYDSLKTLRDNLDLTDLEKSTEKHYIRIWTDKNAIDAWIDAEGNYECKVTSFCKEYNVKKQREGDFHQYTRYVERISAKILIDSLYSFDMDKMDDFHHIDDYNKKLIDGTTYKIEISTPTSYRMFTMLNPENQSTSIEEVDVFMTYVDIIKNEMDLSYIHRQFMRKLKNGTYVAGLEVITKKKRGMNLSFRK